VELVLECFENVEVIGNQDDGIEWFRVGTVNVKNAIVLDMRVMMEWTQTKLGCRNT